LPAGPFHVPCLTERFVRLDSRVEAMPPYRRVAQTPREIPLPDSRRNAGPQDPSHVNVDEPRDLNFWCREFGVPPGKLRAAVKGAKSLKADRVRAYLKLQGWSK